MAWQSGSLTKLGIGTESTPGTAVAVTAALPFMSCALSGEKELSQSEVLTALGSASDPFDGLTAVSGEIVVPIDLDAFPLWLAAAFGPAVAGVYSLDTTVALPSLTIVRAYNTISRLATAAGCRIAKIGLSFAPSGELKASIGIEGSTDVISTGTLATAITAATKLHAYQASVTEGGSALSTGTEISINIDFDLDADTYVIAGGGTRNDIQRGVCKVTGTLKTLFADSALLAKATAGTASSLGVTLTSGTKSLAISIPKLRYKFKTPPISGPKGILCELEYIGYVTAAADKIITFTLDNT
jgi:hypothetical protein